MDPTPETPPANARARKPGLAKIIIAVLVLAALAFSGWFGLRFAQMRAATVEKAVQSNLSQLLAALEQFALESPDRLFLRFEDIYGEKAYLKSVRPVRDEDYRALFPFFLPDHRYLVSIRLPNGRVIQYGRDRTARPSHPDGVHTEATAQGEKFEFTWRGGVRHGPMRAWRADGSLWCEAVFEEGRAVSAIHITRDGRRLDELKGEVPD